MIYLIPDSSSGNGLRVSIDDSDSGATPYKWWSTSQFAGLGNLIFWEIVHSEIYCFNWSFIPTQLCPESFNALYVRSHCRWSTTQLWNFSKTASPFGNSDSDFRIFILGLLSHYLQCLENPSLTRPYDGRLHSLTQQTPLETSETKWMNLRHDVRQLYWANPHAKRWMLDTKQYVLHDLYSRRSYPLNEFW